jgi:protein-arginine kinase activator protein McsA
MVNPKCVMCDTYIREVELKSSGEPYKTCKNCRGLRNKKYKKKSIIKEDENKADEKDMGYFENKKIVKITKVLPNDLKKCFKCRRLFANTGSEDYLTCLNCRTTGKHLPLENVIIHHQVTPEKKMPVWTPDTDSDSSG